MTTLDIPGRRRHDKLAEGLAIGLLLNGVTGFNDNPVKVRAAFEAAFADWSSDGRADLQEGVPTVLAGIARSSGRDHVVARLEPDGETRRIRVTQVPEDTNYTHRYELAGLINVFVTADEWSELASKFIAYLDTPKHTPRHAAA